MKNLQIKYNFIHIFHWMATCSIYGYVAVFLQYKGLSNTLIGICTGGGCICTIFLSPFISSLVTKIKRLTINTTLTLIYIFNLIAFLILGFIPLPTFVIIGVYILVLALATSVVPLLSMIAMNYISTGNDLNFGLSRGIGSVSYAATAVLLGQLTGLFNPTVLPIVAMVAEIGFLGLLYSLPKVKTKEVKITPKSSPFLIIKKYPIFFIILVGFGCTFAASTALSTYLINIVKNLGGDNSLYGIAIFCMAASEMPIMAITPRLLHKYDSVTLIMIAGLFYIVRNFTIALAPSLPILLIGMMMQGFSYGLLTAVITYYVTYNLAEHDQMMGQTMIGIMTSGVGSTIGNVLGGVLQDSFGLGSMFTFAMIITFIGTLIIFLVGRKYHKEKNEVSMAD